MTRTAHLPLTGWVPKAAALLHRRPELAGIGWADVVEAVQSC